MYKKIHWITTIVLSLFSPVLFALGLGGAVVESYLGQPMDVRVQLISESSEELQSITVGLASADDFELLGLSRSTITVPLTFELVTDAIQPYIHITSGLKVNEPVIHVLVEVIWANGRILREYTLFLDPPTFDSPAPPVIVKAVPQPVPMEKPQLEGKPAPAAIVRDSPETETREIITEESVEEEPVAEELVVEEPAVKELVVEESVVEEPVVDGTVAQDTEADAERPAISDETESESEPEPEQTPGQEQVEQTDDRYSDDQVYGPVARGETLWGIASEFSKGSGYSVNQAMLALQRKNPDAFMHGNINSLQRGVILRMPALSEMVELTSREALLEAIRLQQALFVADGETLWSIASELSKGSGYSVNQAMLALQRKNPDAFNNGNINSLKRGVILDLPAFSEMGELTSMEARLEAMRQQKESSAGIRSATTDFSIPTVADSGDYQGTVTEKAPDSEFEDDPGHLELVPPEEVGQDRSDSELPPVKVASDESVKEYLSRTEEELVNAQQENSYLNERIKELEAEVETKTEQALAIENSGLASMESSLAKERAADEAEAPVAITPGGETQAWYAGWTALIAGIAVALIAMIIWGLRRRSAAQLDEDQAETVKTIADEAEELLRTLDGDEDDGESVEQSKPEPEPEVVPDPDPEPQWEPEPESVTAYEDDVEDLEIDDPETKLDLARAYLSLGDKETSKSLLEEVIKSGNDAQIAEARQMMDEL